ncbi:o-succinylbenzoate synthase [Rhizobium sp. S95]|uniref:o-succinylbenzoate synthase n=1 Tax=Ciceribacter sichuanensis TaxID=2949647 RepID=A0AAJ1C0F6_9HYPH|nr:MULTISPECIES: o-succinylbenzoate synthase [unclassified Ciceribacter]MCM2395906.1 o-succinylbenzoate synthase [Ciceribacter sp. S95]MCO5959575.1 o-succinylbenzoate synthase [Ciceribacter sp. S101]
MTSPTPRAELRAPLRIDGADIRLVRLPLLTPFTISSGTMYEKLFPLLTLKSGGLEGYAEGVMDPLPDYLEETVAGALELIRTVFLPQIIGQEFENPQALHRVLQPWRANYMAKATVEMAFWDLWAKSLGLPLKTILGGNGDAVDVGVSLGLGPIAETLERVGIHHEQGYKRIKLKIKPGHDLQLVSAVRAVYPDIHLTADANSAYSLADSMLLARLDDYNLDYVEQPLAWNDIHDHAILQTRMRTSICLDESIRGPEDARKALQTDAARVINIKVGRAGGYLNSLQIHDLSAAFSVPVWCGGMLESGIGRAHNIHLSTLPNFSKPGDTSSSSRYFHRDIVEQKLEAVSGRMAVPTAGAGIGVTLDHDFLAHVTTFSESLAA